MMAELQFLGEQSLKRSTVTDEVKSRNMTLISPWKTTGVWVKVKAPQNTQSISFIVNMNTVQVVCILDIQFVKMVALCSSRAHSFIVNIWSQGDMLLAHEE